MFIVTLTLLHAEQYAIVISKECTLSKTLNIQNIYLKKQHNIDNCHIVPLNLRVQSPIRQYFVQIVLDIDDNHWNRYWDKMHFKGVKSPHIVSSSKAMSAYVMSVPGSIAYIPQTLVTEEMTVLSYFDYKQN